MGGETMMTTTTQPLSPRHGPEDCRCETNIERAPLKRAAVEESPLETARCQLRQGGEGGDACGERLRF